MSGRAAISIHDDADVKSGEDRRFLTAHELSFRLDDPAFGWENGTGGIEAPRRVGRSQQRIW